MVRRECRKSKDFQEFALCSAALRAGLLRAESVPQDSVQAVSSFPYNSGAGPSRYAPVRVKSCRRYGGASFRDGTSEGSQVGENSPMRRGCGRFLGIPPLLLGPVASLESVGMTGIMDTLLAALSGRSSTRTAGGTSTPPRESARRGPGLGRTTFVSQARAPALRKKLRKKFRYMSKIAATF